MCGGCWGSLNKAFAVPGMGVYLCRSAPQIIQYLSVLPHNTESIYQEDNTMNEAEFKTRLLLLGVSCALDPLGDTHVTARIYTSRGTLCWITAECSIDSDFTDMYAHLAPAVISRLEAGR
mgnify:CR=1 FL=1